MSVTLATRFYATIAAVVGLAMITGAIGIAGAWRIRDSLQDTVTSNLPSVIAAEELEIALLLENRAIRSFVMDAGKPNWREELEGAVQEFDRWWAEAERTAHTPEEEAILDRLAGVHRQYATKRDEIVRGYQIGEAANSQEVLSGEFDDLFRQCYTLCEEYLLANQRFANAAVVGAQNRVQELTWLILACLGATTGLGFLLLALVVRGVLEPLRRLISEARLITRTDMVAGAERDGDELRAVGKHLRALASDVVDIRSSLEQHREQLLETEKKLASVGKLAASVAHEIRNPLAAIRMCLLLTRKAVMPNAEAERRLGMADEEITRLDGIIKSFLEFSRPPAMTLCPQPIAPLLAKTVELVAPTIEQKSIHLQREETAGLPPVRADSDQLKQVMLNLLKNATEATPEGGEVWVRTGLVEHDGRCSVVVRIGNTGEPISEEARVHIFEPFFTTKAGGTGLGLCIAARIMAQHGGRLVLESTSDHGTTFAMWLPSARDSESDAGWAVP